MLDPRTRRRYQVRNAAQGVLLLGGMVLVLGVLAWVLFGAAGLVWVLAGGGMLAALQPRVPPHWVLSMYRARPLSPAAAPELHRYVRVLADRAGLPVAPTLYSVPSPMANAFAVGGRDDAALAVTDGLLRLLPSRQLVGVLAHEISHIRADDLWVMRLSDTVGRITHALSYLGLVLLLLAVPLTMQDRYSPLLVAAVLTVLPTVVTLLQLGLSRSREYDADLEAAVLTGDPDGLASALVALDRTEGRIWERMMLPRRRAPDPLLLRTHPPTAQRVRRLRDLARHDERSWLGGAHQVDLAGYRPVRHPARLRFPGVRW